MKKISLFVNIIFVSAVLFSCVKAEYVETISVGSNEQIETKKIESADVDLLYEKFLENEEKVIYYTNADDTEFEIFKDVFNDGTNFYLKDIIKFLTDSFNRDSDSKYEIKIAEHRIVDIGNDGDPELILCLTCDEREGYSNQMVIKNVDNRLKICYIGDSWSRSETTIYDSGYIVTGGSAGAASHIMRYSFVDKNGAWKEWYQVNSDTDFAVENYTVLVNGEYESLDFSNLDIGHLVIENYIIKKENHYTYYLLSDDYKTEIRDANIYDSKNEYRKVFDSIKGLKVYTSKEIENLKKQQQNEIGLLDDILK